MELENVFKISKKRRTIFLLTFSVAFGIFVAFLFFQPKEFSASAKVLLMPEKRFTGPAGSYRESMPHMAEMMKIETRRNIETQLEILKSKPVIEKAKKLSGLSIGKGIKGCSPSKVGDSDIVTITCKGSDEDKVVKFTNSIAEAYIRYLQDLRVSETKEAREFIEIQIQKVEEDLATAEEKLRGFKELTGIVNLNQESATKVANLVKFQSSLDQLKIDLASVRSKIQEVQDQLSSSERELISATVIAENPVVRQLKSRLADLEVKYAGLSKTHGKKHPKMIEAEAEVERTKAKLQNEMQKIIASETKTMNPIHTQLLSTLTKLNVEEISHVSRKETLENTVDSLQMNLQELPESEMELARFVRDRMLLEKLFANLKEKQQDFKISEKTSILPAKPLEKAEGAREVSRMRLWGSAFLGFLLAISCGVAAAFFFEYMDDAIYSVEDVKRYLDLKVLSQIPFDETIIKEPLISHHRPNSPVTESFRSLRNKLKYLVPDFRGKTFLVTSSIIEEGKSCIASNLAITLAQYELNVLLIDGDLRRPALHQSFNVENRGLTNVLINSEEPESVIISTSVKGLDLMCSGPLPLIETSPFNSSELLESKRMAKVIEQLKTKYDVLVIDSPPVLVLTDVLSLSLHASGILFIVDSGYVKRDDSIDAKSELELSSAPIYGAILNKTEGKSKGYYKYLYYYREENPKG